MRDATATGMRVQCVVLTCFALVGCSGRNPVSVPSGAAAPDLGAVVTPNGGAAADMALVPSIPAIRVACGQNAAVQDHAGNSWRADSGASGGVTVAATSPVAIANTDSAALFNAERYGSANGQAASFSYTFATPNADYTVKLGFAETFLTAAGKRRFNVSINGTNVLTEFDIFAAAGGMNTATVQSFPVTVSDGKITITFDPGSAQNPKINNIEIVAGPGAPPPPAGDMATGTVTGAPLIQPPLIGATPGKWQLVNYSGNGISTNYLLLLPYGYSSAHSYPLFVYLHENGYGSDGTGQFLLGVTGGLAGSGEGADVWFNNPTFRASYPAIVVCPLLIEDQDGSGNTQNWGGWGGPNPQPSQLNVITIVKSIIKQYSVYTKKIYVTGDSLGGIGTWEFMIQYNSQTGLTANSRLFAAGWSESGGTLLYGDPPTASVVTALQKVPIYAIRGQSDTSTGPAWDPGLYAADGGGNPDGSKSPNAQFWYLNAAGLGHDVWGTYRNLTASFGSTSAATNMYNWLFSQTSPVDVVVQ
jgi:poly(3-hydroxybutyrate) depolymerase